MFSSADPDPLLLASSELGSKDARFEKSTSLFEGQGASEEFEDSGKAQVFLLIGSFASETRGLAGNKLLELEGWCPGALRFSVEVLQSPFEVKESCFECEPLQPPTCPGLRR